VLGWKGLFYSAVETYDDARIREFDEAEAALVPIASIRK